LKRFWVTHETGHTILYRKAMQEGINNLEITETYQLVRNAYTTARLNGDIYQISEYANEDIHEFFSETFLMYRFDKHKLPKYIIDMIKEIIK
jgi:hypothetical protein